MTANGHHSVLDSASSSPPLGLKQVSMVGTVSQKIKRLFSYFLPNTLYLEAPAGSFLTPVDQHSGFSFCTKAGVRQATCHWDDVTQAVAYGHTLTAFYAAFPEFASNDLYLAGESYAGEHSSCAG